MKDGKGTAKVNIALRGPDDALLDLRDLEDELEAAENAGVMAASLRLRARMAREREVIQPAVLWLDRTGPEPIPSSRH